MRFVDTSFFVALQFAKDERHPLASAVWRAGPGPMVTTNLVLGETWTFLRRRLGHQEALRFLNAAEASTHLSVRHVDEKVEAESWAFLRRHDERSYSFVDAASFITMRGMRIREALAFDGDFQAAGFVEVRP